MDEKKRRFKERISSAKESFDLVEYAKQTNPRWEATRKGVVALCVAHSESNPSMWVTDDMWYCFSCGAHGDAISYIMVQKDIGFVQALEFIEGNDRYTSQGKARIETAQINLPNVEPPDAEIAHLYHRALIRSPSKLSYFRSRGLLDQTIERFKLGYGRPVRTRKFRKPRFTIPVYNDSGDLITVRYRADPCYSEKVKYITMPRTETFLFNVSATRDNDGFVVYTGSQIDAMLLEQYGIPAVGSAGENIFKQGWGRYFDGVRTVILLDNDQAGEYGSIKAWLEIDDSVVVRWPSVLPKGYDINNAVADPALGIDFVKDMIYGALG